MNVTNGRMNVTNRRKEEFINKLKEQGGVCGNIKLKNLLQWSQEFYWKVQAILIAESKISAGRGRGGSVRLNDNELSKSTEQKDETPCKEKELYKPITNTIQLSWIGRFGFEDSKVIETHSQGRKNTGGTFTRPDITAVGIKKYIYLQGSIEVITFEVKSKEATSVIGILEAISHREAAHRSYVIYSTSTDSFEISPECDRISELAQKYGIGIILAENASDSDNWEIYLDAIRHEPDPSRLDRFIGDIPNQQVKESIIKWKT